MAGLGVDAYRFSIAWPRVQPAGRGRGQRRPGSTSTSGWSTRCSTPGIAPVATLFHWDLPQALQDAGGWLNRDTAARFAEYAGWSPAGSATGSPSGSRSTSRSCHTVYGLRVRACTRPGRRSMFDALPVAHHQLLGARPRRCRRCGPAPTSPVGDRQQLLAGAPCRRRPTPTGPPARRTTPCTTGCSPTRCCWAGLPGPGRPADRRPVRDGDLDMIAAPIDVLGVNYYNPTGVRRRPTGARAAVRLVPLEGYPRTAFGWPVVPDGLARDC